MKVAVCYSGLYREFTGWEENHKVITDYADSVYYSTWEGRPVPPNKDVMTFNEPTIHYDPFKSIHYIRQWGSDTRIPEDENRRKDLIKQILGHYAIVKELTNTYDIIIRMRYDTWFGDFNWKYFIDKTHQTQTVYAFGEHSSRDNRNQNLHLEEPTFIDISNILVDFMIIHPGNKIKNAFLLAGEEKLFPANAGWYQILAENGAKNYSGGIQLNRIINNNI